MNKICYDHAAQSVIYKTKTVAGPNRNFEIFDPLDFLAAVTSHIPNRGEHRSLLFAADPLECPDCGGPMRIIAFIEDSCIVRAILVHLSLWDEARPPPVTSVAMPRAPAELEYLPWVE